MFNFCLHETTMFSIERANKWQALVHVCQRWRQIIFASPRRLALHLNCTHRTPVRRNLSFWPSTLPLTIDYPGPPLFRSHRLLWDDGNSNIIAVLEHPSRVHRIMIHAPSPLLSEVATVMQKPFPALKHLDLEWELEASRTTARPSKGLPIPGSFLCESSPLLQHLRLKCISFPQFRVFLLSTPNLVALELKSIPKNDHIPMEAIVASLAALTRVETFSITFYEYDDYMSPPDQNESRADLPIRAILPVLTNFCFRGYCEYLEDFLAQITTPRLDIFRIEYSAHEIEAPQLSQFIDRTENLKLNRFRHAKVMFYLATVVQLDCSQECGKARLILDFSDAVHLLDEQVPYVTGVLGQLVSTFSNIDHLSFHRDNVNSSNMESDWLQFFHLLPAIKALHLSGGVGRGGIYCFCTGRGYRRDGRRTFYSSRLDLARPGRKPGQRRASGIHREISLLAPALWSPCNCPGHGR